jgi:hypothetical protein
VVLLLVLVVAVVRNHAARMDPAATLVVASACSSTAGTAAIDDVLAWPAMTLGFGGGPASCSSSDSEGAPVVWLLADVRAVPGGRPVPRCARDDPSGGPDTFRRRPHD